jgi:Phage portal protein
MSVTSRLREAWLGLTAGRPRHEPQRFTIPYARMLSFGWGGSDWRNKKRVLPKGTPANLRYFSRTVYARRAINSIKNPIKMLEWEIVPLDGIEMNSALQKQADVAAACFKHPNHSDSFHTLVEQLLEDYLGVSAGCCEIRVGGDKMRPLWMFPVDGTTIQMYMAWDGDPNEARYLQSYGYSNSGIQQGIQLRDDELLYMRPNPSAATPYGFGPTEIAFQSINRMLGAGAYAGDVASNANPQNILWLANADEDAIQQYRMYWIDEIEGQGKTPIIGGKDEPKAVQLHGGGDTALYLEWQTFLKREIATAFDISAQNLNVDHDVNRNQGETNEDRDWDQVIKPTAFLVASHFTRDCLHKGLGFYQLQFKFKGLERADENAEAERYERYYKNNMVTPDEWRLKLGMGPMEGVWGKKTYADFQIAVAAARGAKTVDDPDLQQDDDTPSSEKQDVSKAHDRTQRRR